MLQRNVVILGFLSFLSSLGANDCHGRNDLYNNLRNDLEAFNSRFLDRGFFVINNEKISRIIASAEKLQSFYLTDNDKNWKTLVDIKGFFKDLLYFYQYSRDHRISLEKEWPVLFKRMNQI